MTTATQPAATLTLPLEQIHVPDNVRELDPSHVSALAGSISLQGVLVPVVVRSAQDGYELVAGFHRVAAALQLGLSELPVVIRNVDSEDADRAVENITRKQLNPYEEAKAVHAMLKRGLSEDGAAQALGWTRQRVTARVKILALPERAQQMLGSGQLPLGTLDQLTAIGDVSPGALDALITYLDSDRGAPYAQRFAGDPGWVLGQALSETKTGVFAAYLGTLGEPEIGQLRLGKQAAAQYAQAEQLHRKLDRYAYGPPRVAFSEAQIDQARAAGVLIEFDNRNPIIIDRDVYRELAKQAIAQTVEALQAKAADAATEKNSRGSASVSDPATVARSERDAQLRELADQAHGVNLDLGASLLNGLACVDPSDINVARFFVYALLGADKEGAYGNAGDRVERIAAGGIRLVLGELRADVTKTRKDGSRGRLRIDYDSDPQAALTWLWRFLDGARNAGELYGRALVVLAAEHYASRLVLPASKRVPATRWPSRKDQAAKALAKLAGPYLPVSLAKLERAVARTHRAYEQTDTVESTSSRSTDAEPAEYAGDEDAIDLDSELDTDD
jgi:ParB/RepB/Spo0J family partition protein